jgi:hypothetical protein
MLHKFATLQALALLAGAASAQCLTVQYNGISNGQKGTTFEVRNISATPITIGSFDQCFLAAGTDDIEVYTLAGSCAGLELNAGAWTLVGSAAGVVHGVSPTFDPIPVPIGITILPAQTQSFYITVTNATSGSAYYTSGTNQYGVVYAGNVDLQLIGRTGNSYPFGSGFGLPTAGRLWNGRVNYCPSGGGGTLATASSVGAGCGSRAGSFYELFQNGTFDLSNTSLTLNYAGGGYVVTQGGTGWYNATGANLGLSDDSVSAAQTLNFAMPYPGGVTSNLYVSSNGFVWAQSNTDNGCCNGAVAGFLSGGARWAQNWADLNPGVGGTVQFDLDPSGTAAYVTFTNVPEYGTSNLQTFQVAFFNNGNVQYRYQACGQANHQVLAGFTVGGGAIDPGSTDISAITALVVGPESRPLALTSSPRPIINTTITLTTSNITATAPFGAVLVGLSNPNLPLGFLGMPGCFQYTDGLITLLFLPFGSSTANTLFNVPNAASLTLYTQSAVYDPAAALTPFGAVTSNGRVLNIGTF